MSSINNQDLPVRFKVTSQSSTATGEENKTASVERTLEKKTIFSLSNELMQSVFSHLKPSTLANQVELTCSAFRALTKPVYKSLYGHDFTHRPLDTPPNWKLMALEKESFQGEIAEMRAEMDEDSDGEMDEVKPEGIIDQILRNCYTSDNASITELSEGCVLMLHESPEQGTPVWHEAMATLMMAQGRHAEALKAYTAFLKTEGTLPERTWLTAARFGWPHAALPLPEGVSEATQQKAIMGAAAASDLAQVQRLEQAGVDLDLMDGHSTLATVAARAGNLPLMRYLHEQGVDVLEARPYPYQGITMHLDTPLWEAAKYGHVEVARFLLSLGAHPDVALGGSTSSSPFNIAMRLGETSILKLFIEHAPQIAQGQTADGNLLVADLFGMFTGSGGGKRARTIACLIDEAHLDIEATNLNGRRLVHLAAEAGDVDVMEVLRKAGANLTVEDATGQTPEELATSGGHTELATWLRAQVPAAVTSTNINKQAIALEILATQRRVRMKQMATGDFASRFEGGTIEEKMASAEGKWMAKGMDDKLGEVWIRHFSGRTLQQWKDEVLGTDFDTIALKLSEIAGEAAKLGSERTALSPSEEDYLPMVRELVTKIFPSSAQIGFIREKICNAAIRRMPLADLQKVSEFYKSDLGDRIAAGNKAKSQDEMMVMLHFI